MERVSPVKLSLSIEPLSFFHRMATKSTTSPTIHTWLI